MVTVTYENNPYVYQLMNKHKVTLPHVDYYASIKVTDTCYKDEPQRHC